MRALQEQPTTEVGFSGPFPPDMKSRRLFYGGYILKFFKPAGASYFGKSQRQEIRLMSNLDAP
jgi:hypothetical protein